MEKKFWESKLFWLGVINTLIGVLALVGEFLQNGNFEPLAVTSFVSGILIVILRIWFTDSPVSR